MTKTNESRREKFILLVLMLLSFLFVLGCSIKGNEPTNPKDIRYDMCAGVYTKNSSNSYNMIYYGTNQEKARGLLKGPDDNSVTDSSFINPMYFTDDKKWIADGYVIDNDPKNALKSGDYTFEFQVDSDKLKAKKNIVWDNNFPTWNSCPSFEYNQSKRTVTINNPGIKQTENSKKYKVKYSMKIYNAEGAVTQLVGQSTREEKDAPIIYTMPSMLRLNKFYPVLVADFSDENGLQMIMYYCPEQVFNY